MKNIVKPAIPTQQTHQAKQPTKISMAAMAKNNMDHIQETQEWTVVGKKISPQAKTTHVTKQNTKANRRVILVQDPESKPTIAPLLARNVINNAFAAKGVKGPVINLVSKTANDNIAINTTEEYTADFFMEKKDKWEKIIPHVSVQKDQPWYKVVAHGIPLADFDHDQGMEMVKDEIVKLCKNIYSSHDQ